MRCETMDKEIPHRRESDMVRAQKLEERTRITTYLYPVACLVMIGLLAAMFLKGPVENAASQVNHEVCSVFGGCK
jgi:hypothetical protein